MQTWKRLWRKKLTFERQMFSRRAQETLFGTLAWVATPEDVILHKLHWNALTPSERQLGDAAGIVAVQQDSLDSTYLYLPVGTNAPPPPPPLTNCVNPPAGLVSWWAAEGDASDRAGSNDGTLLGGVTYAPAKVGRGFLELSGKFLKFHWPWLLAGVGVALAIWLIVLRMQADQKVVKTEAVD